MNHFTIRDLPSHLGSKPVNFSRWLKANGAVVKGRWRTWIVALSFFILSACGGTQKGGLYELQFAQTPVCSSTSKIISFEGDHNSDLHVLGIAIEPGSDADANFNVQSLEIVNTGESVTSVAGKIADLTIPAGSNFKVTTSFTPRLGEGLSEAVMTVTIDEPVEAIYQVVLQGEATPGENCTAASASQSVSYDGVQNIQITRLVGVSQKLLTDPLTTDDDQVAHPFTPVIFPFTFDAEAETILFPQFHEEDNFILPPSLNRNIANLIPGDTLITSSADYSGAYDTATGELVVENMTINMRELGGAFESPMTINLTTGSIPLPTSLPPDKLVRAGMSVDGSNLVGQQIWPQDGSEKAGSLIFVGIGTYGNVTGSSATLTNSMPHTQMAVQIEAVVVSDVSDSE